MVTQRRGLLGLIATGLAALLFPAKTASAVSARAQNEPEEPLVGSWRHASQRSARGPGTSFITFTPGGCLLHSGTDPGGRPAHGAWVKTADREYDYTWVRPLLDAEGTLSGTRTQSVHVRMADSLDAYTSTGAAPTWTSTATSWARRSPRGKGRRSKSSRRTDPTDCWPALRCCGHSGIQFEQRRLHRLRRGAAPQRLLRQLRRLERRLEQAGIGDPSQPLPVAGVNCLIYIEPAAPSVRCWNGWTGSLCSTAPW
jgi:hypothetical protein